MWPRRALLSAAVARAPRAAVRSPWPRRSCSSFPDRKAVTPPLGEAGVLQPGKLRSDTKLGATPTSREADILAAIEQLQDSSEAAAVKEVVSALKSEHLELREQMSALTKQCAGLTDQVQGLNALLRSQDFHSPKNLMERQAIAEGREEHPSRRDFRPSISMVANQPTHVSQLDNEVLVQLGLQGSHPAHKERLLREIMFVDGVTWEAAHERLMEMDIYNEKYYWLCSMPYRIGIVVSIVGACSAAVMVFYKPVVEGYATAVVGEGLPEGVESISTMTTNQVGAWSWNWMEPMIGTASFALLCCQFARAQAWKLNMRPYTESMQRWRANRLAGHYPQYDQSIVRAWAKHLPMVKANFFPNYRRFLGFKGM